VVSRLKSLWPLLLPVAFLLPGIQAFPYPSSQAAYSDLTITHYPNAQYLLQSLRTWQTIPLWSPTILSGFPFAANPLSGLWYPPGWLALALPLPLGFNLVVAAHLVWGGIGMYRLIRLEGLSHPAALFSGLAFACLPKMFAHYGAGHLTLLYAVPWTPWLLASQNSPNLNLGSHNPEFASRVSPAVILAIIFLADVRWAIYAGGLWWGYALTYSQINSIVKTAKDLLLQTALAGLLAAPLLLPLVEYTRLSTRATLTMGDILAYSLPVPRLFGLFFPIFWSYHEWVLYPGGMVLVLSLAAILQGKASQRKRFWLAVFVLSMLFSLGAYLPGFSMLARLPGLDLLRVPARALFLTGIALAALAADGLDGLLSEIMTAGHRRVRLGLAALVLLMITFILGIWISTREFPTNLIWGAGAVGVGAFWAWTVLSSRVSPRIWFLVLMALAAIEWGVVDRHSFFSRPSAEVLSESEVVASFLASQPGEYRVFSPSYSLPQHSALRYRLEQADGVDPLQLATYAAFMEQANGMPPQGYSVTLPPFKTGTPARDNAAYSPNPDLLGLLNVQYVVAEYDLPLEGLKLRRQYGETRVYENQRALPRAWIQPPGTSLGEAFYPAERVYWSPNQIEVSARGPGTLVLSELIYPGWKVRVDGEASKMVVTKGILRGVALEPGVHQVVFTFRPLSLFLGLLLFVTGCVLLLQRSFFPTLFAGVTRRIYRE
jgi:hypothetical protein